MSMNDVYDGERDGQGLGGPQSGRGVNYDIAFSRARYGQPNTAAAGGGIGVLFLLFGIGWLILAALPLFPDLAFVAVVWASAAAIAGLVIFGICRVLPGGSNLPYHIARETSATALWRYIAIIVAMRIVVGWYDVGLPPADHVERIVTGAWDTAMTTVRTFSAAADVSMLIALPADRWPTLVGLLLVVRGPGILVFASLLSRRLFRKPNRRFVHFLAAVPIAFLTIEVSLSLAVWGCLALWGHVRMLPLETDNRLTVMVIYAAILLLPCAFIGALLGGAIIRVITRWFETERIASFGLSYSTAVRALLAYGFLLLLAVFLFRDADDWVWWVARQIWANDPNPSTLSLSILSQPFAALVVLQLPGLLAAGAVVARGFGVYDGALGYMAACLTAGLTCVTVFGLLWVAGRALPTCGAWVNAQVLW
jgi:hypothetical protein